MARVVWVLDDAASLFEVATAINPLDGRKVGADDGLGSVYYFLKYFPLQGAQVVEPSHDATSQQVLFCAPVEVRASPT